MTNIEQSLILSYLDCALGLLFLWRAFVNANNMNHERKTPWIIVLLNWALAIAGLALAFSPLYKDPEAVRIAHLASGAVFAACMFIGRRPTDRVLSREDCEPADRHMTSAS